MNNFTGKYLTRVKVADRDKNALAYCGTIEVRNSKVLWLRLENPLKRFFSTTANIIKLFASEFKGGVDNSYKRTFVELDIRQIGH
jgi:hypothetical protein